jgi:hypothetical protein
MSQFAAMASEPSNPPCAGRLAYCALRFAAGAGNGVWLALDEDYAYLDRRANGDLSSIDSRVRLPAERYGVPIDLGYLYPADLPEPVRLKMHQFLIQGRRTIYLHAWFADGRREGASPVWSAEPASAPVALFFGPLTFALSEPAIVFSRGAEPAKLEVLLGRPGPASFAWRNHSDIPSTLHPVAEIRFPGQTNPHTHALDRRCCGCRFHAFVDVPDDARDGDAEIAVSFAEWTAGDVRPAELRIRCGG